MQYFDITNLPTSVDEKLQKRLGFKRIFNNKVEIEIAPNAKKVGENQILLMSSVTNVINESIHNDNVFGLVNSGEELGIKTIEKIVQKEKLLIFNAYAITSSPAERVATINKSKKVFRYINKMHALCAIASLAPSEDYLLSSMQLFEIAKLIGASDKQAKEMINRIGSVVR